MSKIKSDPFKDIIYINRINRLLDDSNIDPICMPDGESFAGWSPAVDIYETDVNFVIKAEVPGVDEKDIFVEIKGSTLTLKGKRQFKKNMKEENFYRIERYYGSFQRHFSLPGTIDKEKMEATYKAGILELIIPKKEEKDKQIIKVSVN